MHFVSSILLIGALITQPNLLLSQTVDSGALGSPVFKADASTVNVDVVVTGKDGLPVKGLHKENFEALEDGHPQRIAYFEEHTNANSTEASRPRLPPNVFANMPRVRLGDAVTVLLLDSLNTPLEDQARVH